MPPKKLASRASSARFGARKPRDRADEPRSLAELARERRAPAQRAEVAVLVGAGRRVLEAEGEPARAQPQGQRVRLEGEDLVLHEHAARQEARVGREGAVVRGHDSGPEVEVVARRVHVVVVEVQAEREELLLAQGLLQVEPEPERVRLVLLDPTRRAAEGADVAALVVGAERDARLERVGDTALELAPVGEHQAPPVL